MAGLIRHPGEVLERPGAVMTVLLGYDVLAGLHQQLGSVPKGLSKAAKKNAS